jgi:hypothetical protein
LSRSAFLAASRRHPCAVGGTVETDPFDITTGRGAIVADPFDNVLVLLDNASEEAGAMSDGADDHADAPAGLAG